MMLRALVFLGLLTVIATPAAAADAQFPLGSRIGLVPPPGFAPSKKFPGFESVDSEASMVLMTLPPQAYANIEGSLSADAVRSQGVTEDKREELTLQSGRGLLVAGSEEEKGQKFRKWMFLAAVPEGTVMVAIRVPEANTKSLPDDAVRTSLVSLTVRPTVPVEEVLQLLPFKIKDFSGLRPVRAMAGSGVYLTDGPNDAPEPLEQPLFVVTAGQCGPEQNSDRANFARNMFSGFADYKDVRVVSGDMLRLGGGIAPTHELQIEAKDARTGIAIKVVQWVRFAPGAFIRMIGVARTDQWATAFPRFRAVRDGVSWHE
jgi:hypothetical protein